MGQITQQVLTNYFNLNYISIDNKGVPFEKQFNCIEKLILFIDDLCNKNEDKRIVYLMSCNGENVEDLVFVSQYKDSLIVMLSSMFENESFINIDDKAEDWKDPIIFLQEYDSYEEAYKVALSMQEEHPFCYSEEKKPHISLD